MITDTETDSAAITVTQTNLATITVIEPSVWSDANWEEKKGGSQYQDLLSEWQEQAPICQRSKGPGSVALSATKSEYMAIPHALKEQIWLLRLLKEIGYDISNQTIIYTDDQSAIALAHNP